MLVDVKKLRNRGVKRKREDVHACAPLRATLQVGAARPGWHRGQRNAPLLAGWVEPGHAQWAWSPLDQARVVRIEDGHLLLIGIEALTEGRQVHEFPQAWWCQIVDKAEQGLARASTKPAPPKH